MRFLKFIIMSLLLCFIIGTTFADNEIGNNCIQKDLWDITTATICIDITNLNNNEARLEVNISCEDFLCSVDDCGVYGYGNHSFGRWCHGDFSNYNELGVETITMRIYLKGIIGGSYLFKGYYDFQNGIRLDDNGEFDNLPDNSSYLDVSAKTGIRIGDPIDLTVKTTEDYVGKITISSSSFLYPGEVTWTTLFPRQKDPIITSNDFDRYENRRNNGFFLKYSDEWREGYFNIEPSDNGRKILHDFVTFAKEGVYSVGFTNSDGKGDSITFFVSGVNNNIYRSCGDGDGLTVEECEHLLEVLGNGNNTDNNSGDDMEGQLENLENNGMEGVNNEDTNIFTGEVDKSRYEEGNQQEMLSNGYTRELNNAYKFAYLNGITTMETIEQANMNGNLNRISMAKMLSQYAINVLKKIPDKNKSCGFLDVTTALDKQYNDGVTLACQLGIMGVGITNFRPNDDVTRAEFGTALSRMLYGLADGTDQYYSTHLAKLKKEGIIFNDNPTLKELRGYVMLMLMRSAK